MKVKVAAFILTPFFVFRLLLAILIPELWLAIHYPAYDNQPSEQPLSRWATKDGRLDVQVQKSGYAYGMIMTESGTVEIVLYSEPFPNRVLVYSAESLDENGEIDFDQYEPIERWNAGFAWPSYFKVEVSESTYFTPGEKFTVYRTVKGITYKDYLKFCKKNPEANLSYGEYCEQYSAGD